VRCIPFKLAGGGGGFICGSRQRAPKCRWCNETSTKLCDAAVVGPPPTPHDVAPPKDSCDAPMCDRHAATVGKNIHHCPDHAEPQFDSMNADAMSERDGTDSAGSAGQGFGRKGRP